MANPNDDDIGDGIGAFRAYKDRMEDLKHLHHIEHGLLEHAANLLGHYPCVASALREMAAAQDRPEASPTELNQFMVGRPNSTVLMAEALCQRYSIRPK